MFIVAIFTTDKTDIRRFAIGNKIDNLFVSNIYIHFFLFCAMIKRNDWLRFI